MSAVAVARPMPGTPRNGVGWKPYIYRGAGVDVLTPFLDGPEDDAPEAAAEACWCGGDMRGYRKHLTKDEDPCQASRDDVNLYTRNRSRAKREVTR